MLLLLSCSCPECRHIWPSALNSRLQSNRSRSHSRMLSAPSMLLRRPAKRRRASSSRHGEKLRPQFSSPMLLQTILVREVEYTKHHQLFGVGRGQGHTLCGHNFTGVTLLILWTRVQVWLCSLRGNISLVDSRPDSCCSWRSGVMCDLSCSQVVDLWSDLSDCQLEHVIFWVPALLLSCVHPACYLEAKSFLKGTMQEAVPTCVLVFAQVMEEFDLGDLSRIWYDWGKYVCHQLVVKGLCSWRYISRFTRVKVQVSLGCSGFEFGLWKKRLFAMLFMKLTALFQVSLSSVRFSTQGMLQRR